MSAEPQAKTLRASIDDGQVKQPPQRSASGTLAHKRRQPKWLHLPRSGLRDDVQGRLPWYRHDWEQGVWPKWRILAPATYIFFASAIPALAFGQQFIRDTDGQLSAVQVLVATGLCGAIQAVFGGQPLLIVGVAEPIVLIYTYMYDFARTKPELGPDLFLPWAAWACLWTACLIWVVAASGACRYVNHFTAFSGEIFGMLIAVLFIQQTVHGLEAEFRVSSGVGAVTGTANDPSWRLVNGCWAMFISFGLIFTTLLMVTGRSWRLFNQGVRGFLADYGVPLMVVVFSCLAYAVVKGAPDGIPRRMNIPNTWDVTSNWLVTHRMGEVPGKYIAGALIPAIIITILFYFDHSVSSLLAQTPEFNLRKPPSYSWDFVLLGGMTLMCGMLGIPPVNGVLPQAPMHTRSLATLRQTMIKAELQKAIKKTPGGSRAELLNTLAERAGKLDSAAAAERMRQALQQDSPDLESDGLAGGSEAASEQALAGRASAKPAHVLEIERHLDDWLPVEVQEQRISALLQSMLVGVCLAITPLLKFIPTSVLWGYFSFMALQSLPSLDFWNRLVLLVTDPTLKYRLVKDQPYIDSVRMRTIIAFTVLQLMGLGAAYGVTWAGIVGSIFPVVIIILVPIRRFVMPRMLNKAELYHLDPAPFEEAPGSTTA